MPEFQQVDVPTAQELISGLPGDYGDKRVSSVYVDGVPVEALARAIAETDFRAGQRQNQGARFWATPPRPQSDQPTRDVFEADLSVSRLVNYVAFDLAHFPHRAEVEYSTTTTGPWAPLLDANGRPIVIEVIDSNPPVLPTNANQNLLHPQHFGAGHWLSHRIKTVPVQALRYRVVLTRPNGGVPPTDSQGIAQPYSLGVRAFVVGYDVETQDDIPSRALRFGSLTTHEPIESTRDLLGSSVSYSERENPAINLIEGGVWRSGPQPLPYAVVNLYADVRGPDLQPQVIERFFIDPITSGCSVNLYYTTQVPDPADGDDPWEYVEWTPVARDFACRRGFMRFDPTLATYFKFEFTDLAPEPYDSNEAVVRMVRLFPGGLESRDPITRSGNTGGTGTFVNGALDGILRYEDNDRPVAQGLTDLSRGFSPTEVYYSKDPAAAARLRDLSEHYNFMPWQGGTQAPHWPGTQTHPYLKTEVLHDQRVAFYIALAGVTAYRLDYSFDQDTDQYLDYFHDTQNIETNDGWVLAPSDLSTQAWMDGVPATLTSKIFDSRTDVRGVQFATTQSPPLQLLPDDDFNSGDVTSEEAQWVAFGQNGEPPPQFEVTSEFATDIGTTVVVRRDGAFEGPPAAQDQNTYRAISRKYLTWRGITDRGLTYADLERVPTPVEKARVGGIRSKIAVTPAPGARLYAAARVFSKHDLGEPLYVQVYDRLSGKVVAEAPKEVSANKITEWYVSYDPDSAGPIEEKTWNAVVADTPTWNAASGQTYYELGHEVGKAPPVQVEVRLVQKSLPNASWVVDTLSLFEESILWEFSNDGGERWFSAPGIRNNPSGVLLFPEPLETAAATTYDAIEGSDPSPARPTYGSFSSTRYKDMEHGVRTVPPNRSRLRWRLTCARGGQHVAALSVRPWYTGSGRGVLSHEGVDIAGPNTALYDHYQPVHFDPRFRLWNKPIPQAWYFFYRQFTLLRHDEYVPTDLGVNTVLGTGLVVPRRNIGPSADVLGEGLVIPVGGPTPPEPEPLSAVLPETLILRST